MPKIVSASPVATWFEPSVSTRTAKSIEEAAPATAAQQTANQGARAPRLSPNVSATAKPVTAPTSIMPSTPRLSTPLFSTTSSPVAASRIGVVTPTTVTSASMMKVSIRRPPAPARRAARRG